MNKNTDKKRVVAFLDREELEFLEKLGMDSRFSSGRKLTKIDVITALIDAAMSLGISAEGVKTKKELVKKILTSFQSHQDRRKFPRLEKSLAVGLRKMDTLGEYSQVTTKDASLGGFKIEVCFIGKPFNVNQLIEVTIADPKDQAAQPIKAICRVAWVKQKEDEHAHEVGVTITYIKEEDKARFAKYLNLEEEKAECILKCQNHGQKSEV